MSTLMSCIPALQQRGRLYLLHDKIRVIQNEMQWSDESYCFVRGCASVGSRRVRWQVGVGCTTAR